MKNAQIILRIDDEYGHHIIRKHVEHNGWPYTIEGYEKRPENYLAAPAYYFPFTQEEVAGEFAKQGKEFRV